MTEGIISAEPGVVAYQVKNLIAFERDLDKLDVEGFELWAKAGIPAEYTAEASKAFQQMLKTMDRTIAYASSIAQIMVAWAVGVQKTEEVAVNMLNHLLADMQAVRDAFAAMDPALNPDPKMRPLA